MGQAGAREGRLLLLLKAPSLMYSAVVPSDHVRCTALKAR